VIVPESKMSGPPLSPIRWIRVDDRLIHGQVVVAWRQQLGYEAIWVVDDVTAGDAFLRDVLCLAAPADVQVTVYTVQQAIEALQHPASKAVLLLTKTPASVLQLVDAGVPIAQINVGNIAAAPGRRRVFKSISLGPEHVAALDALAERGVEITFQLVPNDTAIGWERVRKKWGGRE
jgi:PTS system mannose-specific IIB component